MAGTEEKKDLVEKEFIGFPDVTADIINVLLYQGKREIVPGDLCPGPTETIYQGQEKLRSQYEDLCKYEIKDGHIRVMYLIANQSRTDSKIALRKAGYVGGAYREQYEGKVKDTFPVIELVLYWGSAKWRDHVSIRQLFWKRKLPLEIWKYIDEIRVPIFGMRNLPEETRKLFQSDMRIVADYLALGDGYRSQQKIVHKAALIKMIKVLSGELETDDIEKWMEEQGIREEDEITVCELFDQYVRQGRNEGRKYGEARRLVADIENAVNYFQVTLEKACEGLGTTVSGYEEAKKLACRNLSNLYKC